MSDEKVVVLLDQDKDLHDLVVITHEAVWADAELTAGKVYELSMDLLPGSGLGPKQSLVVFEFTDKGGNLVEGDNQFPQGQLGRFLYLPNRRGKTSMRLHVPKTASKTRIGVTLWHADDLSLQVNNAMHLKSVSGTKPASDFSMQERFSHAAEDDKTVVLSADPIWVEVPAQENLDLEVMLALEAKQEARSEKSLVLWTQFLDDAGNVLAPRVMNDLGKLGPFTYIDVAEPGAVLKTVHVFTPANCRRLRIGLATWKAPSTSVSVKNNVVVRSIKSTGSGERSVGELREQPEHRNFTVDRNVVKHSYIRLGKEPAWTSVAVNPDTDLRLSIRVDIDEPAAGPKAGLIQVRFMSSDGEELASRSPMKSSDRYGHYIYMDAAFSGKYDYSLSIPSSCVTLQLSFQVFAAPEGTLRIKNHLGLGAAKVNKPTTEQGLSRTAARNHGNRRRNARDLKVALVCDEFSYNSFSYEFDPVIINPDTWRETLDSCRPDIFLCESAWSGTDSEERPWKGKIYASSNFVRENRTELLEILAYCRSEGIPTVFWNKEDPTHYEDRVHDFVETAKAFDYVFTTDIDLVPRYREEHGIENIDCLPFATQPRLFNPVETHERTAEVVFAGSWYSNHEDRSREMESIFDSILLADVPLVIYDRYYGTSDPLHMFPERFLPYTRPPVSHIELAEIYKSSLFGLNINTVTDSKTMFARRVFELMSSNSLVLSNYSAGIVNFFSDNVVILDGTSKQLTQLSDDNVERIRDENLHHVLGEHTYRHRFEQILDTLGIDYIKNSGTATLVVIADNRAEVRSAIARFRFLTDVCDELLIVLNDSISGDEIGSYYTEFNRLGCTVVSKELWKKQKIKAEHLMSESHFVLVDDQDYPSKTVLQRALLHCSYVDEPIIFGAANKYGYTPKATVKNLIASREFLEKAVMNYGVEIKGSFYHV